MSSETGTGKKEICLIFDPALTSREMYERAAALRMARLLVSLLEDPEVSAVFITSDATGDFTVEMRT